MDSRPSNASVLGWTTQIVSAHIQNNAVLVAELSEIITSVYRTLNTIIGEPSTKDTGKPAVAIRRSVTPDYIVCLEDGKKLKMLKRHLRTAYNLTPEEYRRKWALPSNYPMVAPNYAIQRSVLAKKIGLGSNRRNSVSNK